MAGVRPEWLFSVSPVRENQQVAPRRREILPACGAAYSPPLSVAVARNAYYQGYLPVTQSGDAYVEMEYLFLKRRAG